LELGFPCSVDYSSAKGVLSTLREGTISFWGRFTSVPEPYSQFDFANLARDFNDDWLTNTNPQPNGWSFGVGSVVSLIPLYFVQKKRLLTILARIRPTFIFCLTTEISGEENGTNQESPILPLGWVPA